MRSPCCQTVCVSRIRVAGAEDLGFLCDHDAHVSRDELERIVLQGRVLLAEHDGLPVGWLRWGLFWDQIPFMNLIHVLPQFRDAGIGSDLISSWEERCRSGGSESVMTSTQANERAQHLYRKHGYVDRGCLLLPGEPLEIIFFKRFEVS